MKTVYLVRHATAVGARKGAADFGRALLPRGEKEAKALAKALRREGIAPDVLISSPVNRALETAHVVAKGLGHPVAQIVLKDAVYENPTPKSLLAVLQEVDGQHKSAMIIGHDPSLSEFAAFLLKDFKYSIPKAGLVCIEFRKRNWAGITESSGKLKLFAFAMDKESKSKIDRQQRKELEAKISDQLTTIIEELGKASSGKIRKLVKKSSKQLAQGIVGSRPYCVLRTEKEIKSVLEEPTQVSEEPVAEQPAAPPSRGSRKTVTQRKPATTRSGRRKAPSTPSPKATSSATAKRAEVKRRTRKVPSTGSGGTAAKKSSPRSSAVKRPQKASGPKRETDSK